MTKRALLDREKVFVEAYARSGDVEYSSAKAGYPARTTGYDLLHKPMVKAAIDHRRQTRKLLDEAAPRFVDDLVERLAGRRGGEPSHADAAKLGAIFWKAYYGTEGARPLTEREASEMTGDEMRSAKAMMLAEAERLEAAIAERAKPVAPIEAGESDVFD